MERDLKLRTKSFAHDCVKLALQRPNTRLELLLQGQLIRSSTSVAANYRAACIAQSKKAFISKLSIAIEEVDESNFWLVFAKDENIFVGIDHLTKLINESKELTAILVSSRITTQKKMNNE